MCTPCGLLDMPHGVANAVFLPHVCDDNLISNPQRFADIAEFMGENIEGLSVREAADVAIDAMKCLSKDVGIPSGRAELKVKESDLETMAENAMKDGNAFSTPRVGNKNDIISIFKAAM